MFDFLSTKTTARYGDAIRLNAAPPLLTDTAMLLLIMSILCFIPPASYYLLGTDSHSAGLAVASLVIIGALGIQMWPRIPWGTFALIAAAIVVHLTISALLRPLDLQRAALSLGLLALITVVATYLSRWLFVLRENSIAAAFEILRYLMVAFALLSLAGWQPEAAFFVDKPVFPFTEPSHFALIFVPLVAQVCITSRGLRRYVWLGIILALSLLLKNLSMLVGTILIAGICLPLRSMAIAALAATSVIGLFDMSYFIDRLDFSARTTNQSSLVYLQGWELATDSLARTWGWGVGFQQLGIGLFDSPSADALFRLYRVEANLYDGGFVAAKIASEFGVLGILIILTYVFMFLSFSLKLRTISLGNLTESYSVITAYSIFVCYSVDMFVRGLSYFSASSVLFIASSIFLLRKKQET